MGSARVTPAGRYDLRVVVLRRVLGGQLPSGEVEESWPEPAAGTREYFAHRRTLSAGEVIMVGLKQSSGFVVLAVKGRAVEIADADRVRVKSTGEVYHVVGVAREAADTVVSCERVARQEVGR